MKYNNMFYESPELRYADAELEGFVCSSELGIAVDELNSFWGDEGTEYDGDIIFE